jgi:tRNA threonylcarbamoyladenosine biosynthesis protein TsaB
MLLALDTATQYASIALYDGQWVLAELNWRSERRHTVELAPQVNQLLRLAGVTPADLTVLGVGIGPGSYTGTRIALSFAKGIALSLAIPLVGVSTLDALAYPHLPAPAPLCALVAAGRGRYGWAIYTPGTNIPQRETDFGLHKMPELLPHLPPNSLMVGEMSAADRAWVHDERAGTITLLSPARALRRAGALAELAWARFLAHQTDDPVSLSPIYLG